MRKIVIKFSKNSTDNGAEWKIASHTGLNGIDQLLPTESNEQIQVKPEFLDINDLEDCVEEISPDRENPLDDESTDACTFQMMEPVVLLHDCFASRTFDGAAHSSTVTRIADKENAPLPGVHLEKEILSPNDDAENDTQIAAERKLITYERVSCNTPAVGKTTARFNRKPFKCEDCSSTFAREYYLRRHRQVHTKTRAANADAPDESSGNEIFHSVFSLRHRLSSLLHYGVKKKCHFKRSRRVCQSGFLSSNKKKKGAVRVAHLLGRERSAEIRISRFLCNVCPAQFESKGHLYTHLNIHKDRPFTCNACFRTFTTNCALRAHSKKHKLPARYICSTCFIEFPRKTFLKEHLEFHAGF